MQRLLISTMLLLGGLAACATAPEVHTFEEHPAHGSPDLPDAEARHLETPPQDILGLSRSALNARMTPGEALQDGWVAYSDALIVRFEADIATELKTRVPDDLGCKDTVAWLGYDNARVPIMRKDGCLWPFDSPRHGLGKNISAILDFESRTITIKKHP